MLEDQKGNFKVYRNAYEPDRYSDLEIKEDQLG